MNGRPLADDERAALRRFHYGSGGAAPAPLPGDVRPALMLAPAATHARTAPYPLLLPADPEQTGGRPCVPLAELRTEREGSARAADEPDGRVVQLDSHTALWLLDAAARQRVQRREARLREDLRTLAAQLRALLAVESRKDAGARTAEALDRAVVTAAGARVDPHALSRVLGPPRGTERMSAVRRCRIEEALRVLDARVASEPPPVLTLLLHEGFDTGRLEAPPEWRLTVHADPCAAAGESFDREAARLAEVFRAARTARLELENAYDAPRHEPWLSALDWQAFTEQELLLVPPIVAVESAKHLAQSHLPSLTSLLLSGRPVQVIAMQQPEGNPTSGGGASLTDYRLELGYLGIAHREVLVQQSTAALPDHLIEGFTRSLAATRASLHVLACTPDAADRPSEERWLRARAAVEARAHPLFRYDPDAGATWARRLSFSGNPEPQLAWPRHPLHHRRADGTDASLSVAFTFADYALLEPALRAHFRLVPDACADDELMPIAEHLALTGEAAARRLPFVWAMCDGGPCRAVVTRELELACRDRMSFWSTLQELAGVRNEYVEKALQQAEETTASAARGEHDALEARHRAELARARTAAVEEAMHRLAQSLLSLDPDAFARAVAADAAVSAAAPPRAGAPAPNDAPADAAAAPAAASAAAEVPAGPWVETPLCTSCNDCVQINSRLFVFDQNKQVTIGDPRAGTYAQLVRAAEKCPARCIHPGEPLDPAEPGLEALRRRAAPFNA